VAIVTAGMHAPEITPGIGYNTHVAAKRYRAVTWQRSIERTDDSRSGNSTPARNAKKIGDRATKAAVLRSSNAASG
jgi:hypothetical protein